MMAWHDLQIKRSRYALVSPPSIVSSSPYLHIIGPNGSGKTSLLLALAHLIAYRGTITWQQVTIRDHCLWWFSRMGWCPDTPRLPAHLTVAGAIQRALALKTNRAAQSGPLTPTHDLVIQLGLHRVWDAPIPSLSLGYQKRVGLAMALGHHPDCVLLDEPTLGLDDDTRSVVREVCLAYSHIQWVVATHREADFPLPSDVVALSV